MAGCASKKYAKGGMVKKFADGGAVMAPTGRLPVAGPPPNAPQMAPRIARMPPPDQTMPMPSAPPMAPRISRMPPRDQGRPMMNMRSPRGFKDGGLVSKVKPPGGRGTKSCKIC